MRGLLFGGLCVLTGLRGGKTIERPDCILMHSCSRLLRSTRIVLHCHFQTPHFSPCHSCINLFRVIRASISTFFKLIPFNCCSACRMCFCMCVPVCGASRLHAPDVSVCILQWVFCVHGAHTYVCLCI